MDEKRIRKLEDTYIKMQQTQEQILKELIAVKKCTITKDEMDLANEKLVERIFQKVENNFARKERIKDLEEQLNKNASKESVENIEATIKVIVSTVIAIAISVAAYIVQHIINLI